MDKMYGERKVYRIAALGGIGDVLLLTPAIRALRQSRPQSTIKVLCIGTQHRDILLHNPNISSLKMASLRSAPIEFLRFVMNGWMTERQRLYSMPYWARIYTLHLGTRHATEIMGDILGVDVVDRTLEVFLTSEEEARGRNEMERYRNPVLIQVTGRSSPNKDWHLAGWEELVRRNAQYTFVQVGRGDEPCVPGVVDLRARTSVRESIALLKYALAFVSVESFLPHAANAVGTRGVVLCGPSNIPAVVHPTSIMVAGIVPSCAPCIDILATAPCPYGNTCMTSIKVADVELALEQQVSFPRTSRVPIPQGSAEALLTPGSEIRRLKRDWRCLRALSVAECEEKIQLIDNAIRQELSRPFAQRRPTLLNFLSRERNTHELALAMRKDLAS